LLVKVCLKLDSLVPNYSVMTGRPRVGYVRSAYISTGYRTFSIPVLILHD